MVDRWSPEGEAFLWYDINTILARYARGVDRKDWELMLTAFHEDATDDHGSGVGTPRAFAERFAKGQGDVEQCQHVNGQVQLLEVDRGAHEVLVESYCIGYQRLKPGATTTGPLFIAPHLSADLPTGRLLSVGNRYFDLMTERDGELRIARRTVIYEWMHVDASDEQEPLLSRTMAERSKADLTYTRIADFRL
jgi:hypothetical protein